MRGQQAVLFVVTGSAYRELVTLTATLCIAQQLAYLRVGPLHVRYIVALAL
jgi:hypothetical protein